jgi:mannose-6-phosphate isomerase-like protein (cupin superfamily)
MTPDRLEDAPTRLFGALRIWLASLDEPVLRPFLEPLWRAERRRFPAPIGLPVLSWLDVLPGGAAKRTAALVTEAIQSSGELAWGQTYGAADFGQRFLERYGWTELAGQRGPFYSDEVAAGLMMLGPDTDYPAHRHVAEEFYIVLSGTASWSRDEVVGEQAPGRLIHHPSMMWHGVATSDQPLLTLYLWRGGDLTQKSEIQAKASR